MWERMTGGSGGGSVQIDQGSVTISATGSGNAQTVNFPFAPDFFFFYTDTGDAAKYDASVSTTQYLEYHSTGRTARNWDSGSQIKLTYNGDKTVTMYANASPAVGTYKYIALKE